MPIAGMDVEEKVLTHNPDRYVKCYSYFEKYFFWK